MKTTRASGAARRSRATSRARPRRPTLPFTAKVSTVKAHPIDHIVQMRLLLTEPSTPDELRGRLVIANLSIADTLALELSLYDGRIKLLKAARGDV